MLPYYMEFMADREQYCAAASITYYEGCLDKFEKYTDGKLWPKVYNDYVRYLRRQNISNTSLRTYAQGVKVYLNWLLNNELINIKLIGQNKLPRKDNRIIQPLTTQEMKEVDSSVGSERGFLIVHLMVDCGLRRGEVKALEWRNIDFGAGLLRIEKTKSVKPRIVPIPYWLLIRLEEYKTSGIARPFDMTDNAFKQMFQKLKKRSGIERIHAHLLRHTFGTSFIYYKMGDLYRLSLLMGHQEISTTCTYLHLANLYDIEKLDIYRIDDVFRR